MQIEGLPQYNDIRELKLTKQRNDHSRLRAVVSINEELVAGFEDLAGRTIKLRRDKDYIFYGIIQEARVEWCFSRASVEVLAVSLSVLEDDEEYFRIFQAEGNTCGDIIGKLEVKKCGIFLAPELQGRKYPLVALQNRETNFAFIRRMAKYAGADLWIKDDKEKAEIYLQRELIKSAAAVKTENIISQFIISKQDERGNKQHGMQLKLQYYLDLGRRARVENDSREYLITGVLLELEHGSYYYTYELMEPAEVGEARQAGVNEETICFPVRVKSQDDPEHRGRLQVLFDETDGLEDKDKDKPRWLMHDTPYTGKAGGVVFLPDAGDAAEAVFCKGKCVVVAARREQELAAECRLPKDKYIGNNTQQRIFWKEKSLELKSGENLIYMDADKIELTVGQTAVRLNRDSVELRAGSNVVKIDNKEINAIAGAGKININSVGTEIDGNKVELNGSGGKITLSSDVDIHGSQIKMG